jgi:uroporphyrinogen III methyltransferase/synthase
VIPPIKNKTPLTGRKILITRAREQSAGFTEHLRRLGAEVILFPTIEIVPPLRWDSLDQALDQLKFFDWIIFTSVNGVQLFWKRLGERGMKRHLPPSLKVCAIGPATAKGLVEKGVSVDYVPHEYIAEAILEAFKKTALQGKRILLARAKDVLPKGLRTLGAEVSVVEVYRTVKPRGGSKKLMKLLEEEQIDGVAFTSSSTVNHFVDLLKRENLKSHLRGIAIACIGPVTARTAKAWGMNVAIQPKEYTIPGLTQAIAEYFKK